MRRLALRIDQMPAWAFVAAGIVAFGLVRAGRLVALLQQSPGGLELGGIATFVVFLAVVIFAVRRRQVSAWRSTVHVMSTVVVGNALALALIWPLVPNGYALSLAPILMETLSAGATMAVVSLPLAIALLWLSRRYGSHSQLTERRLRVIREVMRKRLMRGRPPISVMAERDAATAATSRPNEPRTLP